MKFICMGFIDPLKFAEVTAEEGRAMMEECFEYDDELRRKGCFLGGEALQSAENAVTLRIKNGAVDVTDGPYAETKEFLGGILLLEARDLNHAISLMSLHPGVKTGPFEIRPAHAEVNALIAARDSKFAKQPENGNGDTTIEILLNVFSDHLTWLEEAVADIPDERFAEQPGGIVNHPAWTLSHLNAANGALLGMLDEPEGASAGEENEQFGPGTIPVTDRGKYASKSELLETLKRRHQLLDAAVRVKHAEYFQRPSPEFLQSFSPTIGPIATYLLASHESYHLAQLMPWRRAAGFKKEDIS